MPTRKSAKRPAAKTINNRDVKCADFVAGDQITNYGFAAADVERLIDKVLAFLQAGATFVPRGEALRAEIDGAALTFQPGAVKQLIGCRDLRSYLLALSVHRDYQVWATKFIPLAAQMDVQRAVEGLELPIAFSEFHIPHEGDGPDARVTTVPLADITEALKKHSAFVILGEPGGGKTTTLQKIAFEAARTLLSGGAGRVPLFIRLSQQGARLPFEFMRDEWEQRTGLGFADALASGRVLLLADGINELPRDDRDERLKAWRLFTTDYCDANQIVFSGRERDYDRQLDLPRVRVEPLDDERIADYLRRNAAVGLGDLLDDPTPGGPPRSFERGYGQTRLREMARNPFNLLLLAAAYKSNQRGMGNRGGLLKWFVGELFSREERLAHRGWLPRTVQVQALAQLAYTMQRQGESTTLPVKTARVAVPPSIEFNGEDYAIKPPDLFRFARAATLIDPTLDPDVRFYHHLLQEYFAALDLLRRFDAGEDLSVLWQCQRTLDDMPPAEVSEWDPLPEPPATGWEVTTILAGGLATHPAQLIEAIRLRNPVLAGRCLDEAGLINVADADSYSRYPTVAALAPPVRADLLRALYDPALHVRARLQAGFTLGRVGDPRFAPQLIHGVKVIVPTLVKIPADRYTIGSANDDTDAYDDEKPQHTVDLPALEMGKWPITNAEYKCFMDAGGYQNEAYWTTDLARRWLRGEDVMGGQSTAFLETWKFMQDNADWKTTLASTGAYSPSDLQAYENIARLSEAELTALLSQNLSAKSRERPEYWLDADRNNPSQPVVGITWFEANAYCAWLSAVTDCVYRLPTEVEWEAAARGVVSLRYPWGNDWDATRVNTLEGRVLKPSPVGAYTAAGGEGPFGAEDQSGNVWNWTSTIYRPYPYHNDDCELSEAEGERVIRGGSWYDNRWNARCASRNRLVPVYFYSLMGFRVFSPGSISAF